MEKRFVISCDLGTSGVKVVFFSLSGQILASVTESYPLFSSHGNYAEQNPELYWQAVCKGTRTLFASGGPLPGDCAGMAFGTQWKGIIPISADGRVLRNSIIWMDKRAAAQADALNRALGKPVFCESDYWPKLAWFRENEPELYAESAYILEANAYLKWKATGVLVSDITNHYTRSYSEQKQAFYDEVLRCAHLDPEKFPPLCEATDLVGYVTGQAAQELGLPAGVPVFGGCCDIPALAIGSGCCAPGDAHAYLGTSGWLGYIAPHDPEAVYLPPLDRSHDVSFYGLGVTVGPSTSWVLDQLYAGEKKALGSGIWKAVSGELAQVPPGSDRLLAAPWFFGGRPPFSSGGARGAFINLNGSHTRAHMLSAVLEGFCYIMRQNLELLNSRIGHPLGALTICGGGTNNAHWMQAMANILKIDVRIPRDSENAGAVGVAYCALIGLGARDSFETLKEQIAIERIYHPQPNTFSEYDLLYAQFTKLHDTLSGIFNSLNQTKFN